MATEQITVEVSKEMYELGEGVADFVGALREALADGFQAGSDLPKIAAAALEHLTDAVQGLDQLDDEWAENKEASLTAALLIGAKIIGKFS